MFGPRAFDCDVESQLASKGVFYSETIWAYSFDRLFSAPEVVNYDYVDFCLSFSSLSNKNTDPSQLKLNNQIY